MTVAILGLLGALVPFALWLWKRRADRRDDPLEQHRQKYEQIEKPVRPVADLDLSDDLDELERLRRAQAHQRRPGGDAP